MTFLIDGLSIAALAAFLTTAFLSLRERQGAAQLAMVLGFAITTLLIAANAYQACALPLGNMRHVLCFFSFLLAPAAYVLRHRLPLCYLPYFALAAAAGMAGALSMPVEVGWRQMPALQSPWFGPHVASYVTSYGLLTVATLIALRSLVQATELTKERELRAADALVRFAFPLLTFGLWSGALWADVAWARYWAWDVKEVWSLITWMLYILYFHVAQAAPRWRLTLLILAFVALLITFLVVNLLPQIQSVHAYA